MRSPAVDTPAGSRRPSRSVSIATPGGSARPTASAPKADARPYPWVVPTGWLGWNWGDVPSWVGSVLTSSSLGIAAVTYFRTSGDRRRALDEAERAQVARVSLWWVNPRKALVRNSNDVAVNVRAFIADQEATSDRMGLGPGETRALQLSAELDGKRSAVSLAVVDSHGRSWIRRADGTLNRVTTESSASLLATRWSQEKLRWEAR
jgi:hypothetical protein